MRCDEIDSATYVAVGARVEVGAARNPQPHAHRHAGVALDKAADVVTEVAIPFGKAVANKGAHLVETARIPRFGDDGRSREHRVRLDGPQQRRT